MRSYYGHRACHSCGASVSVHRQPAGDLILAIHSRRVGETYQICIGSTRSVDQIGDSVSWWLYPLERADAIMDQTTEDDHR